MNNPPNYTKATNAAYDILIKYNEFSFPIGIFSVIRKIKNIRLHTYTELAEKMNVSFNKLITDIAPSCYGFTVFYESNDRYIIYYNESKDDTTVRFTLAHELGHIVLKHREDGDVENKEANCFARNYLCPIPVVKEMNLCNVNDYTELFYVSEPMAKVSIDFKNCDLRNISTNTFNTYNDSVMLAMNGITPIDLYGYNYGYYL